MQVEIHLSMPLLLSFPLIHTSSYLSQASRKPIVVSEYTFSLQKSHNQPQYQYMHRIKCIINILKHLVMRSLFTTIQPNRNQRKYGKALLRKPNRCSKQVPFIRKSPNCIINIRKCRKLSHIIPPLSSSQKIKSKNHPNTILHIVHHG